MSQIRHIYIKNFRSIKEFEWFPKPGLNCLIGAGDSGKSTVLDAIDLALGARRSYPFTDADFHKLDTSVPIEIFVTLGGLSDQLKNIETYGKFLRSFNKETKQISDEPVTGEEIVITIRMVVGNDLDADWLLYSERADSEGLERRLSWKHRELITPARLGVFSDHHLAWGNRSVLNKLSEGAFDLKSSLAQLGRNARDSFSAINSDEINDVLKQVKDLATNLGVSVGDLKALLDVNSLSLSNGAISLHNNDNTPLRQLGTGSSRLLISGLQKAATASNIFIVDEAEYGLEPYRITRLLNELGSKENQPAQQVFITTHSPYVLRELQASQLFVLKKKYQAEMVFGDNPFSHNIFCADGGNEYQKALRACAEAFFSKLVVVCEGKTEIGLIRGMDLFWEDENQGLKPSILALGVYCANGDGDSMFARAKVFKSLGYPTVIFKDSDKNEQHTGFYDEMDQLGIKIFEWGNESSTEDALFNCCPVEVITKLLEFAIERNGEDSVKGTIQNLSGGSFTLEDCFTGFNDSMRPILATASKGTKNRKAWFKDIAPAEHISINIIGSSFDGFSEVFTKPLNDLFSYVRPVGFDQ